MVYTSLQVSACIYLSDDCDRTDAASSPISSEPYSEIVKAYPHLDGVSKEGCPGQSLSLLHREIEECVKFSGATEVSDGVWVSTRKFACALVLILNLPTSAAR